MNVDEFNEMLVWNEDMEEDVEEAGGLYDVPRDVLMARDPFQLSDHKFVKLFMLPKPICHEVIEMVTPFIILPSRKSALSITTKASTYNGNFLPKGGSSVVLAALRFYATGSYQEISGSNSYEGISQVSTSRAIQQVTEALNRPEILRNKVVFPNDVPDLEALRTRFYRKYAFPGPVGVIDCTHIAIVAPKQNEHIYVNRKNYHSLNVQLVKICDKILKILNCNARFPGSTHDAYIWRQSPISDIMENIYRGNPGNMFFLLGDSGYPTRPWLLTALANPRNHGEKQYNDGFSSIRSIIERCNGILKSRFRCLLRYRTLHYDPITALKIVNACSVLHNTCVENIIPEVDEPHDVQEPDFGIYAVDDFVEEGQRVLNPVLAIARATQQTIILNHFA